VGCAKGLSYLKKGTTLEVVITYGTHKQRSVKTTSKPVWNQSFLFLVSCSRERPDIVKLSIENPSKPEHRKIMGEMHMLSCPW